MYHWLVTGTVSLDACMSCDKNFLQLQCSKVNILLQILQQENG